MPVKETVQMKHSAGFLLTSEVHTIQFCAPHHTKILTKLHCGLLLQAFKTHKTQTAHHYLKKKIFGKNSPPWGEKEGHGRQTLAKPFILKDWSHHSLASKTPTLRSAGAESRVKFFSIFCYRNCLEWGSLICTFDKCDLPLNYIKVCVLLSASMTL